MLKQEWADDHIAWERERKDLEDEKMKDIARLQDEMDRLREEDEQVLQQAGENSTLDCQYHRRWLKSMELCLCLGIHRYRDA